MRLPSNLLLVVATAACAPTIDATPSEASAGEVASVSEAAEGRFELDGADEDAEDNSEDGSDADMGGGPDEEPVDEDPVDDEPIDEEDGDPDSDEPEQVLPRSGEFDYSFTLEEDPCGWREVMETFSDGIADVMPTEFDIEPTGDGFFIEAIRFGGDFGTTGPVRCTIDGSTFECAPQSVCPVDMFLCSYGWQYEVTFSGEVVRPSLILGTSVVQFVGVDEDTASGLASVGLNPLECTQTFDMRMWFSN